MSCTASKTPLLCSFRDRPSYALEKTFNRHFYLSSGGIKPLYHITFTAKQHLCILMHLITEIILRGWLHLISWKIQTKTNMWTDLLFSLSRSSQLLNSEVKMQNVWDSMNQVKSQWLVQLSLIPMVFVAINCQKAWSQKEGCEKECPYSSTAKKFSVPLKERTGAFWCR